jgi:hypothetical protein
MQYYGAPLKNDAILRRATKKRCNITSARSQVRGHKNTNIALFRGSHKNRCKSMRHYKNDAILRRATKKRCNITRALKNDAIYGAPLKNDAILRRDTKNDAILRRDTKKRCNITARH